MELKPLLSRALCRCWRHGDCGCRSSTGSSRDWLRQCTSTDTSCWRMESLASLHMLLTWAASTAAWHCTARNRWYICWLWIIYVCVLSVCRTNLFRSICVLQNSRRLQGLVLRCALKWKHRALCSPNRVRQVRAVTPKKSVTFCLPASGTEGPSQRAEQEAGLLNQLWVGAAAIVTWALTMYVLIPLSHGVYPCLQGGGSCIPASAPASQRSTRLTNQRAFT